MKSTLNKIQEIKNNGYNLDFSEVFTHTFENYKKIALYAGLILLIISILSFFLGGGIFASIYGTENLNREFFESLQRQEPTLDVLLISIAAIVSLTAIFGPFTAGFLKMADCAEKDETFNFSTIFTYYKAPYFFRIFIASLLISLLTGLISIVFSFIGIPFVDTLLSLTVSLFTSLTIPLIIFGNLETIDAIKSSIIIVSKQPVVILLLFIVAIIGSLVGFIGCCIGVVFTIPITYSVKYAIYSAIIGIENQNPIDSIGQSDSE